MFTAPRAGRGAQRSRLCCCWVGKMFRVKRICLVFFLFSFPLLSSPLLSSLLSSSLLFSYFVLTDHIEGRIFQKFASKAALNRSKPPVLTDVRSNSVRSIGNSGDESGFHPEFGKRVRKTARNTSRKVPDYRAAFDLVLSRDLRDRTTAAPPIPNRLYGHGQSVLLPLHPSECSSGDLIPASRQRILLSGRRRSSRATAKTPVWNHGSPGAQVVAIWEFAELQQNSQIRKGVDGRALPQRRVQRSVVPRT